jgi:S-adenosylmethionine-diacylglycerol 3-amino-3-carboxypropyl transferase
MSGRPTEAVRERASWERIRYASVWEDADVLCEALASAAPGGRVLCIASAGDNALALLTLQPEEVIAVDFSAAQLACVELRLTAFRTLEHEDLLSFIGIRPSTERGSTYARLRGGLSDRARAFWDAHPREVDAGIVHAGKFERYLRGFGRWLLPLVHSRRTIRELMEERDRPERERFYAERWDTLRWRLLFRAFFSRAVMGRAGRDPAFFAHVEGSVADSILDRTRYALTALTTHDNPYLSYILTGNYPETALPRYLRPEHHRTIRDGVARVRLVQGAAQEADGPFDAFALSDIFEYLSAEEHDRVYAELVARARPGALLAYWNLLAPRGVPAGERGRVRPLHELAENLHARDRAWFYRAFQVDEVLA